MAMHPGFGLKGSTQDAVDYRLGEAGAVVRNATGVPRYGVFPPGVSGTGRSDMKIDVSPFVAYLGRGAQYGGVKSASDGTEPSPTFDAAPSSNSRIDVLWVKQNDSVDASDADNDLVFGIAKGTAAGSPTAPSVPTGAVPLLDVKLPALVGATNAAGVTITPSGVFTVAAGGILPFPKTADLIAFAGANGQVAESYEDGRKYERVTGAWLPLLRPISTDYVAGVTPGAILSAGSTSSLASVSKTLPGGGTASVVGSVNMAYNPGVTTAGSIQIVLGSTVIRNRRFHSHSKSFGSWIETVVSADFPIPASLSSQTVLLRAVVDGSVDAFEVWDAELKVSIY